MSGKKEGCAFCVGMSFTVCLGSFTQDVEAQLHANLCANPLMLLASCVNSPIEHNVFHCLHVPVAGCSASCVNWALEEDQISLLKSWGGCVSACFTERFVICKQKT